MSHQNGNRKTIEPPCPFPRDTGIKPRSIPCSPNPPNAADMSSGNSTHPTRDKDKDKEGCTTRKAGRNCVPTQSQALLCNLTPFLFVTFTPDSRAMCRIPNSFSCSGEKLGARKKKSRRFVSNRKKAWFPVAAIKPFSKHKRTLINDFVHDSIHRKNPDFFSGKHRR